MSPFVRSWLDRDDEVAARVDVAPVDARVRRMLLEAFAGTQFELNPIRALGHLDGVATVSVTLRPGSATDLSLAQTVPEIVPPAGCFTPPASGCPG